MLARRNDNEDFPPKLRINSRLETFASAIMRQANSSREIRFPRCAINGREIVKVAGVNRDEMPRMLRARAIHNPTQRGIILPHGPPGRLAKRFADNFRQGKRSRLVLRSLGSGDLRDHYSNAKADLRHTNAREAQGIAVPFPSRPLLRLFAVFVYS